MTTQTKSNDIVTRDILKEELDVFAMQIVHLLEPRFQATDNHMDAFDAKLDRLTTTLDDFLKRLGDLEADNHARDLKLARLEAWAEKVATKTGIKLEY